MARTFTLSSLFLIAALVMLAPVTYAQDVQGAKDHPMISRYAGSTIMKYEPRMYARVLVPVGPVAFAANEFNFPSAVAAEGKHTAIQYKAPVGRTSLEVFANYEDALKGAGFEILYSCKTAQCGNGDTFAQTLFGTTTPPLTLNSRSQAYLAAKLARDQGDIFVRLFTIENDEWWQSTGTAKGQAIAQLDVIESKPMQGGQVTVDAAGMRAAIAASGRVALYGIYFDSGKADVKPESKPALQEIIKLMKLEPAMRLLVVGHTDNEGSIDSNRVLSQHRAQSVVQQLVEGKGVAPSRLTAIGVGFASPVASNRSDEGRSKNRRVELVEY